MVLRSEVKAVVGQADKDLFGASAPLAAMAEMPLFGALVPVVAAALLAGIFLGRQLTSARMRRGLSSAHEAEQQEEEEEEQSGAEGLAGENDPLFASRDNWELTDTRFCPVCFGEYVRGTLVCEDCGVDLVEEGEIPEDDPPIDEGLVRVCQIGSFLHSQMIRQYLAANRIPCTTTRSMFGDAIGCDFYVFESDALRAKRLIHQYMTDYIHTPV